MSSSQRQRSLRRRQRWQCNQNLLVFPGGSNILCCAALAGHCRQRRALCTSARTAARTRGFAPMSARSWRTSRLSTARPREVRTVRRRQSALEGGRGPKSSGHPAATNSTQHIAMRTHAEDLMLHSTQHECRSTGSSTTVSNKLPNSILIISSQHSTLTPRRRPSPLPAHWRLPPDRLLCTITTFDRQVGPQPPNHL